MCDTALGAYDAEQTNRLSSYFGERDTSFGESIIYKNPPTAILSTGDYRARLAILQEGLIRAKTVSARRVIRAKTVFSWARLAAVHIPVHCPEFGVGRLNGSLLFCLRKDVALVSRCVPGLGRGNGRKKDEKRKVWETAHFMCTVYVEVV